MPIEPVVKYWDKCPACLSESKLVTNEVKKEILAGRVPRDYMTAAIQQRVLIFDQRQTPKLAGTHFFQKAIEMALEVCGNCGCVYCVEAVVHDVEMVAQLKMPTKAGSPNPFMSAG
jgi:hypothetical protein